MSQKTESPVKQQINLVQIVQNWSSLIIIQSGLAILWLLIIPKEPANAVWMGYSLRRLALLLPMLLPVMAGVLIKTGLKKPSFWARKALEGETRFKTYCLMVLGGAFLSTAIWSFVFLFFFIGFFPDPGAFFRLIPMLSCYFLVGLEAVLIVPLFILPIKHNRDTKRSKFSLKIFFISFLILAGIFLLIEFTGLGKNPERVSIISLGVPLLESQIWYISGMLILVIFTAFAWRSFPDHRNQFLPAKGDLIIAAILWLAAVTLWMSLPLPRNNYFAPEIQPPNFEKYPFSDAEQYDYNSLYVYYGALENFVVSKPMYVTLLTILHAIGGLSYTHIVFLQTMIVALFPPILYLIGRELHSRLGGVTIALFGIFREVSSIQASNIANTSNTKLLLSDMPASLLVALLALTIIRWLKQKEIRVSGHEFLIGGLIGMLILTRIQTMILVPFALLLILIRYRSKLKIILFSSLIFMSALALVISPVLLRNHSIIGVYWIDNPSSSSGLSRILTTGIELDEEFSSQIDREEVIAQNTQVFQLLISKYSGIYLYSILDNLFRNFISTLLILPVRLGNTIPFMDYLYLNTPFWAEVYVQPNALNAALILLNCAVIALGFSIACKRFPKAVISVLGLYLIYSLSSAVVRLSGWRFIMPVDWIIYSFYALGLIEVIVWLFNKLFGTSFDSFAGWLAATPELMTKIGHRFPWYGIIGFAFLFAGSFIPAREMLLPPLIQEYSRQEVCSKIDVALQSADLDELESDFMQFCLSENTRTLKGYGLYPRFFNIGEGYYRRSYDPWFGEQPYSRVVFRLIGTRNAKVYIKTENENISFANGATVYLAGREKTKFEAQFVLVDGAESQLIVSAPILTGEEALTPLK